MKRWKTAFDLPDYCDCIQGECINAADALAGAKELYYQWMCNFWDDHNMRSITAETFDAWNYMIETCAAWAVLVDDEDDEAGFFDEEYLSDDEVAAIGWREYETLDEFKAAFNVPVELEGEG